MIASVIYTNEQSIGRVVGTGLPVALIFWRAGALTPEQDTALDGLAQRYAGRALIAKVNVQEEPALSSRYGVVSVPTTVIVHRASTIDSSAAPEVAPYVEAWLDHLAFGRPRPLPRYATPRTPRGPAPAGNAHPVTLTDATFEQMVNQGIPVLVDFWAAWCGPCRMIAPAVEQLARDFAGRAVVAKLNIDDNPHTAQRYQVMSIPTLLIFKRGEVVDRIVGAQPAQVLRDRLAYHAN